jgi:hypothetical protein
MKKDFLAWIGIFLSLVVGRLAFFTEPFGISVDESTYLSIAEILQRGGVLYRDAVDRKPPGLFWFYEGIGTVFGVWNLSAVHFVFFVLIILLAVLIFRWCKLWMNSSATILAVALFAIHSSCFPREVISSNAEYPMLLFCFLAIVFLCRATHEKRVSFVFLAGVAVAVACLFKQYAVIIYAPVHLVGLIQVWRQQIGRLLEKLLRQIKFFCAFCLGLAAVGSVVVYYFARRDALEEFYYYFIFDGLHYVKSSRSQPNHETSGIVALLGMLVSWPLLWFGAFRLFADRKVWRYELWILVAAVFGAICTTVLSGRYYTHYFVPVIFFLSILAAYGLESFRRAQAFQIRKGLLLFLGLAPFVFYAFFNLNRDLFSNRWSFTREKQSRVAEVSEYIQSHSLEGERIAVWGMASQIYVMSKRGSGTRFIFSDFVSGRQPGFHSELSIPTPGAMDQFILDLAKSKPKFFVDTSPAQLNDYGYFPLERFPALRDFIKRKYVRESSIAGFDLWRIADE